MSTSDEDYDALAAKKINAALQGGEEAYLDALADLEAKSDESAASPRETPRKSPRKKQYLHDDHRTFQLQRDCIYSVAALARLEEVAAAAGRLWALAAGYMDGYHCATSRYPWFKELSAWLTQQKREPGYEWLRAMPDDVVRGVGNAVVDAYVQLIRSQGMDDRTKRDPEAALNLHFVYVSAGFDDGRCIIKLPKIGKLTVIAPDSMWNVLADAAHVHSARLWKKADNWNVTISFTRRSRAEVEREQHADKPDDVLLGRIWGLFEARKARRMHSTEIACALSSADCPVTASRITRTLWKFKVWPVEARVDGIKRHWFARDDVEAAWLPGAVDEDEWDAAWAWRLHRRSARRKRAPGSRVA